MAIRRPRPEEIVVKLRQVEVLMGQGMPRIDAIRQISVTEQTYYSWKKKYGEHRSGGQYKISFPCSIVDMYGPSGHFL